ncbi:MAG: DEAD/DEAH box helicase [Clostridiales bacterium]|nr:DEAD/DEAH box helicase [Clostridiales bacterium]
MSFDTLGLMPIILKNVRNAGYETPTPIQQSTIPLVLLGKDVLGCAQTGTGKTAAFALPMIQHMAKKPIRPGQPRPIRQLILTPTRELALQIYENFVLYGKSLPVYPCVIFGGVGQQGQVDALQRGADTVIACPGRLWDLMNQGYVRLDSVETFVLDEADRMLDMGFIHDVRRIAAKLPPKHQTLLFSATMPSEVEKLAMDLLNDPETVKVDPVSSTVKKIDQCLYYVDKANKKFLLAKLLREADVENALVFSRTKHGADRIVRELKKDGIEACAIHGDKSQGQRQNALARFKSGESKVLIATDIAARGIDIAGLSHVFNYDMPMEPEAYVHRIGRTGRAGRDGKAISFCCIDEMKQLEQVEKLIGKRLPVRESEWPMLVTTPTDPKEKEAARQLAKAARLAKLGRTAEMPRKLTQSGNPAPERKAQQAVKAPAAHPARTEKNAKATPKAAQRPVKAASPAAQHQAKPTPAKPAVQAYKPRFGPGSENHAPTVPSRPTLPKGGKAMLIGSGGKVQLNAPKSSKQGLGKPVQRVNHARGRNGER